MYIRTITYKEGGTVVVNIYLFSTAKKKYYIHLSVSYHTGGRGG